MSNYNNNEIDVMTDIELKQFVVIATKMLENAKNTYTKAKLTFDLANQHLKKIEFVVEQYWSVGSYPGYECQYSNVELKKACFKVSKLEFRLKEIGHNLSTLKSTIGYAKTEIYSRSSVGDDVQSIFNDMFDEV